MATDRQGGRIVIECDSCDETFEGERGEEWETLWPRAKREGWKSAKVAGEWMHGCPKHSAK